MSRLVFSALFAVAIASAAALARAESARLVDGSRIQLKDVSDGYDDDRDLALLDLGPSPPPGSSRLLSRGEVEDQLRAAGDDGKRLRMPSSLRVQSAAKRWSASELQAALTPAVVRALPPGVTFQSSKLNRGLVTSPSVRIGSAHLPRFPKRMGELTVTATVELVQDSVVAVRVPITLVVQVTEAATHAAAEKGARVNVVIAHGAAKVSALSIALADTDLGEVGLFRVSSTQRVLRARLESPDSAQVVQ